MYLRSRSRTRPRASESSIHVYAPPVAPLSFAAHGPGDSRLSRTRAPRPRSANRLCEIRRRQGVLPRTRTHRFRGTQVQGYAAVVARFGKPGRADRAIEGRRVRPVEDARAAGAVV